MRHTALWYAIAFSSGAIVMIVELVGSRLLAPYLGTSIFIWTSIIGVILAALSLGYYLGGAAADRFEGDPRRLTHIFLAATLLSAGIPFIAPFISLFASAGIDLRLAAIGGSIVLFGPVTLALGMVAPYLAKMLLQHDPNAGRTVGTLYAVSTLGSIAGTFLGGFLLISYFGTSKIFMLVTAALGVLWALSMIGGTGWRAALFFALVGCGGALTFEAPKALPVLADIDTPYERWFVYDAQLHGRPLRLLVNNVAGIQSMMYLDAPAELAAPYLRVFDAASKLVPDFRSALLIGAGGYTYPTHFAHAFPGATLDIVEIDPALKQIAERFFAYRATSSQRIHAVDARHFLNAPPRTFDAVFLDAFSSDLSIPAHLTTLETALGIRRAMSSQGVLIVNAIGAIEGPDARFIKALYATYREAFPRVVALQVHPATPHVAIQNIALVAFMDPSAPIPSDAFAGWNTLPEEPLVRDAVPVLTDDFSPVEKYMASYFEELAGK